MSPELIINDWCFDDLWRVRDFTAHLFNITIDEGHCISQWGKDFHPEYSQLGKLRWLLPPHVPLHVVSATLPAHILKDVSASLNMQHENTSMIRLLNDQQNVQVAVVKILHSPNSFHNINRILYLSQGIHPPKFMIFCNSRQDSQRMAEYLHGQLHPELHNKIVWFHSGMTQEFRMDMTEKLCGGELWGMCCTDAAGMVSSLHRTGPIICANMKQQGLDIRDIKLVVQWGYTHSLCTLMQRLGHAARDPSMEASGFYFVEKDYKKRKGNGTKVNGKRKARVQQGSPKVVACLEGVVGSMKRAIMIDGSKKGKPREQPSHRSDHESSDSGSESGGNEINDTLAPCRNNGVSMSASPGKFLPLSAGMGIDEFELVVMGFYIEAGNQTICRRRIADEYFENNLIGEQLCSDAVSLFLTSIT